LAVIAGLFFLAIAANGLGCPRSSNDPFFYNPTTFDLRVTNNTDVDADIYVDGLLEATVLAYDEIVILDLPENVATLLEATAVGVADTWGPRIIDTRYKYGYNWVLNAVFDLNVVNDDSTEADVYIDSSYQDFADPYSELVITDVPESVTTTLEADAWDGSGTWGPDVVDTTYLPDYTWTLDPAEWFTLTVINNSILQGGNIWVDDQDCGPFAASETLSIIDIPTNEFTKIEIVWDDTFYAYGPSYEDTRGGGTGFSMELEITIP